jgi:hypothetical protein
MVAARKKKTNEIRICIDPRDLNKALLRPHHPMRTIEEIVADMPNAKVFSVLDAKSGFWQIQLDEHSSHYTTFSTPFGRYRFLRMPYGINSGSEVFQKAMEQLFSGLPCKIIVDDIIVWGADEQEHDANLKQVLDKGREINIKFGIHKCKFGVSEVSYIGHLLTKDGLKPDPTKVKAISEMPTPQDTEALHRFLGMINYLSKFINNFSQIAAPLYQLLHKDIEWQWLKEHQKAFDKLKQSITNPPVLGYYNVKKEVTLTCDASKAGLGAACLQEGKPIAYASRAMTETETRYAQIEKELLAVVFACEKFRHYVYGKSVTVETDHQPLITIIKKPLYSAPIRLQKMMLKLQSYDIDLIYKRGKDMYLADTLSRAFLKSTKTNEGNPEDEYEVMTALPLTQKRNEELRESTANDPIMQQLNHTIMNGWSSHYRNVPPSIKEYFAHRDDLTVENGVILKGQKILVPKSLRSEYISQAHKGHIGVEATKRRARDIMFWPEMSKEIEQIVSNCSVCNSMKKHQQKEPIKQHPIPEVPRSIVAMDIFEWNRL